MALPGLQMNPEPPLTESRGASNALATKWPSGGSGGPPHLQWEGPGRACINRPMEEGSGSRPSSRSGGKVQPGPLERPGLSFSDGLFRKALNFGVEQTVEIHFGAQMQKHAAEPD